MKQLLGIALVLSLGLLGTRQWFGRAAPRAWSRFFFLTGEEFLFFGFLLGPQVTNLLDRTTLASLEPFVGLGLGYIGFAFGMQFDRRGLARVPGRHYLASAAHTACVATVLAVALGWWFRDAAGVPGPHPGPLVAAFVATGIGTSTSFLFLVDRHTQLGRSELFRFMRFSSVFDDLWAVVLFGAAVAWALGAPVLWLGVSAALGGVAAAVLLLALRARLAADEELLVLVGTVLFTGGLAAYLKLSPVFTNAVAGIVFANLYGGAERVHRRLLQVEKPIHLFMLVVAGALWAARLEGVAGLLGLYVLARAAGKWAGGAAAGAVLGAGPRTGLPVGFGLLAQSEMAVALLVNLLLVHPGPAVQTGVSALFLAVVLNDLLGSAYFARAYRRA